MPRANRTEVNTLYHAKMREASQRHGLTEKQAQFLVKGFRLIGNELRRLEEILQKSSPEQLKQWVGLAEKGNITRKDIHQLVSGTTRIVNRRLVPSIMRTRNPQELLDLPKGFFGRSLSNYRQEKGLTYTEIIPIAIHRMERMVTDPLVRKNFERVCQALSQMEKTRSDKRTAQNMRTTFWAMADAHL